MVEFKRCLTLHIVISVLVQLVECADNHLFPLKSIDCSASPAIVSTSWLPPGNFTVASCFSLYRSKAGRSEGRISGLSAVSVLMSVTAVSEVSDAGSAGGETEGHGCTRDDVCELYSNEHHISLHIIKTNSLSLQLGLAKTYLPWRSAFDERRRNVDGRAHAVLHRQETDKKKIKCTRRSKIEMRRRHRKSVLEGEWRVVYLAG